jgi:hypothetical protein
MEMMLGFDPASAASVERSHGASKNARFPAIG